MCHHTCFFPQEPQAAAPAPAGEDVPRASLCSVQSAPPKPAALVSGPLGTEKCPRKVVLLPCTVCSCTNIYFILTQEIFASSSRYYLGLQGVLESQAIFTFLIRSYKPCFFLHLLKFFVVPQRLWVIMLFPLPAFFEPIWSSTNSRISLFLTPGGTSYTSIMRTPTPTWRGRDWISSSPFFISCPSLTFYLLDEFWYLTSGIFFPFEFTSP